MSDAPDSKRAQGLAILEKLFGPAGKQIAESLDDVAPDMGRYMVETSTAASSRVRRSTSRRGNSRPSRH